MSLLLGVSLKQFNISGLDSTEFIRGFALVVQIFICNRWMNGITVKAGRGFDANVEKSDFE